MSLDGLKPPEQKPNISQSTKLKNKINVGLFRKAKELLTDPQFIAKLSPKNLANFAQARSKEKYKGYRAWNKKLIEDMLGLKNVSPANQLVHVMAYQIHLNQKIGGFTRKPKRRNCIDGMCGPYTVGKTTEYIASLQPKQSKPEPQPAVIPSRAPDVIPTPTKSPHITSYLPEGMHFDHKNIFYAGNSFMYGICGKGRVKNSNKIVKVGAQLNHYIKPRALRLLQNPKCKMLVINGGINELYSRGYSQRIINNIIDAYKTIIDEAHRRGIKVTIYTLNIEAAPVWHAKNPKLIAGVKAASIKINKWIANSNADVILNSSGVIHSRMAGDNLHPTSKAYADLYSSLVDVVQTKAG